MSLGPIKPKMLRWRNPPLRNRRCWTKWKNKNAGHLIAISKLRNLSFNINGADPNNEFENVPAYIRRNLELYNTISNVENFYSNYEVKTDENNNTEISTINTFLDGKKPD